MIVHVIRNLSWFLFLQYTRYMTYIIEVIMKALEKLLVSNMGIDEYLKEYETECTIDYDTPLYRDDNQA